MSILALDPGPEETGYVHYIGEGHSLASGVVPNAEVLEWFRAGHFADARLTIEMIASYGMPVGREVFETCVWIGRFIQAWRDPSAVRLMYRREVKTYLCNSVKAKDSNVWQALVDKFGAPGTKANPGKLYGIRSHARAALAVAVTAHEVPA